MGDEMFRRPRGVTGVDYLNYGEHRSNTSSSAKPSTSSSRRRQSSRRSDAGSVSGLTPLNRTTAGEVNGSCTEALLASVFDQVSPVTPDRPPRSRRGHPGSSTRGAAADTCGNEYLAYSSDEEYETFMQQPRTDYTYARSVSYNTFSPQRVGPPSMSRVGLHSAAGDSPGPAGSYYRSPATAEDAADQYEKMSTQVFSYRREVTSYEGAPAATGEGAGDTPVRASAPRVAGGGGGSRSSSSPSAASLVLTSQTRGRGLHAISPGLDQDSADEEALSADSVSERLGSRSTAARAVRAVSSTLLWPLLQLYTLILTACRGVYTHLSRTRRSERQLPEQAASVAAAGSGWTAASATSGSGHRYRLRSTPQRTATLAKRCKPDAAENPPALYPVAETGITSGEYSDHVTAAHSVSVTSKLKTLVSYINPVWWAAAVLSFTSRCVAATGRRLNPVSLVRSVRQRAATSATAPGWLRSAGALLTGAPTVAAETGGGYTDSGRAVPPGDLYSGRVVPPGDVYSGRVVPPGDVYSGRVVPPGDVYSGRVVPPGDVYSGRVVLPGDPSSTRHQSAWYSGNEATTGWKDVRAKLKTRGGTGVGSGYTREEMSRPVGRRWCFYLLPLLLLVLLLLAAAVLTGAWTSDDPVDGPWSASSLTSVPGSLRAAAAALSRSLYSGGVSAAAAGCCAAELVASLAAAALTSSAELFSSLACLLISAGLTTAETGYLLSLALLHSAADTLSTLAGLVSEAVSCVSSSLADTGSDVAGDVTRALAAAPEAVTSAVTSAAATAGAAGLVVLQLVSAPLAGLYAADGETSPPAAAPPSPPAAVPLEEVQRQLVLLQTQLDALQARHKSCGQAQHLDTRRRLTSHLHRVTSRLTSQLAAVTSAAPRQADLERLAAEGRESGERSRRLAEEVARLEKDVRQLHGTLWTVQESLREARSCCNDTQSDWSSQLSGRLQNVTRQLDERVRVYTAALKQDLTSAGAFGRAAADGISRQEALSITQHELALYDADKTGKFDFALESAGGSILSTQCTEAYTVHAAQYSLLGVPLWHSANNPRSIIQPSSRPGECFAFRGEGMFVIGLSRPVRPVEVVLEHIARELTPERRVDSAPRHFSVLGMAESGDTPVLLGEFQYDAQTGPPLQQFAVTPTDGRPLTAVQLRVHSNWGEPEYTCLYRFRVHGEVGDAPPP